MQCDLNKLHSKMSRVHMSPTGPVNLTLKILLFCYTLSKWIGAFLMTTWINISKVHLLQYKSSKFLQNCSTDCKKKGCVTCMKYSSSRQSTHGSATSVGLTSLEMSQHFIKTIFSCKMLSTNIRKRPELLITIKKIGIKHTHTFDMLLIREVKVVHFLSKRI